jgi:sarcosine oxidase
MGSATLYHLARRGLRVLGLERYDIPHAMGSSHGVTRIIRLAYFEHPTYVPLLVRAYELWRQLEREAGEELLCITGSLDIGRPGTRVLAGSLASCNAHGLPHEVLTRSELEMRFPAFHLPQDFQAVLQPDGGFLFSERCIVQHTMLATVQGAVVRAREAVRDWEAEGEGVRVHTTRGEYMANRLVVTAGAWSSKVLAPLNDHTTPERQVLGWFQPVRPDHFTLGRLPVFNLTVDEGHFYGFPEFSVPGFKVGLYHHLGETVDPDTMDREPHDRDEAPLRQCVERYFPDGAGPTMALKTCMFTNTMDEHFVIDTLPDAPQVAFGAGFSGHGFKFASVVGEILADLAEHGKTRHDISRFALARF